nr:retrovirus-related Pol polyprotein from transposon TNT 1-94 [Tanacetum cinerariifolium]
MATDGNGDPPVPNLRTMKELCQPTLNGRSGPIALIAIQATNFGLKNDMIQQVQNSCQFHGLPDDDANKHLDKFLHVTQSIKLNGVTDDALRMYLFPHSLTHHATTWFDRLPRNSINTFEQMAKMFLGKYFPPSMVTKLRNEITNFRQRPNESLFEAWERYKLSIDRSTIGQTQNVYAAGAYNQGGNSYQPQGASHGQNPPPSYQAPAYQAPGYQALVYQASIPQPQVVTTTEFTNYMKANDAILKNMQTNMTSLTNSNLKLKNMFGQFMKMNAASSSSSGTLPSNTITNPNEDLMGITTRSGNAYNGPTIPTTSSPPKVMEHETEVTKDTVPPTNNESTKYVQPLVVQTETPIPNSEPVVAPIVEPIVALISCKVYEEFGFALHRVFLYCDTMCSDDAYRSFLAIPSWLGVTDWYSEPMESKRYDFLPMTDEKVTDESSEEAWQSQSPTLTQDLPLSSSNGEPKTRSLQELYEKHGIDYEEVFAPVDCLETIRMIIAIAAQHKWKIHQMDMKSAFLNGLLEEEVYVEQPEGYVAKGHEERYTNEILKRFGMDKCNPVGTPIEHKVKPSKHDGGKAVDSTLFKSLVGSLCYLTCTRPDILFVVGLISRFMEEPTTKHLKIAKRILRYIKGTIDYGMFYSTGEDFKLVGYSDSDWVGSKDDGRSTSGFLFFLGNNAFTWSSKKQSIITLSSCEAEYVAATSCVCHPIWLRSMLKELHMKQEDATEIYVENKSAIDLPKNPVYHDRRVAASPVDGFGLAQQ